MDKQTVDMVRGWLALHNGNVESVARWMRDTLRIGGLRACRELVQQAVRA